MTEPSSAEAEVQIEPFGDSVPSEKNTDAAPEVVFSEQERPEDLLVGGWPEAHSQPPGSGPQLDEGTT